MQIVRAAPNTPRGCLSNDTNHQLRSQQGSRRKLNWRSAPPATRRAAQRNKEQRGSLLLMSFNSGRKQQSCAPKALRRLHGEGEVAHKGMRKIVGPEEKLARGKRVEKSREKMRRRCAAMGRKIKLHRRRRWW